MSDRTPVKKGPKFTIYSDGTIRIDCVRASYPHLDKPYAGKAEDGKEKQTPKFSIVGLADKEEHEHTYDALVEFCKKLATEKKVQVGKKDYFIRDGDDTAKAENQGMWTISASEERRPSVRDRKGTPVDQDKIDSMFYGGCYVNIFIRPWVQDNKYGKKVNAGLVGVQFLRDGEAFGEGRISDDGVWDTEDEDEDEDL